MIRRYFFLLRKSGGLKVTGGKAGGLTRAPYVYVLSARLLPGGIGLLKGALDRAAHLRRSERVADTAVPASLPFVPRCTYDEMCNEMLMLRERLTDVRTENIALRKETKAARLLSEQSKAAMEEMGLKHTALISLIHRQIAGLTEDMRQAHCKDLADLRDEHAIEKERLSLQMARLIQENERLRERCSRGHVAEMAQQMAADAEELEQLRLRRDNNMGATKLLNLEKRRCSELKRVADDLRSVIQTNWGKDTLELAEAARGIPRLNDEIKTLKVALKDAEIEISQLNLIVYPPPPMERGAYEMRLRFTIMKLIAVANVCHTRVPAVYSILANYFGIVIPSRERKILVKLSEGVRQYEKKIVPWIPSANTCENIRSEMGPLSQLQVGEAIIEAGGTAGNFAVHMDGASSEGRELSAFVLGHRRTDGTGLSKIQNLLFDIRWAMDKTSATRAADFRSICKEVAALCEKANMTDTQRIATLVPSASMNDRANAELAAARMITQSETVNPTCGEHGAAVNPGAAGTKAMDTVVRGWMGKSDEHAKLEEHKVRALNMAVGWNSSPSGALLYCTSKYAASFSDKGYAVGQEARGYNEYLAQLNADDRESILALGHMEDLLSIKGSRCYVTALNAPIVDRILQDGPGSFYRFLKEQEELARPGGGRIRKQILAGAESPEVRACVRAEAILGAFFIWPILRAIKHKPADGSDPHILDMAPIYQEAFKQLTYVKDKPRLVATDQVKLLPSFPHLYPTSKPGEKTKDERVRTDMARIYAEAENCTRMEELLTAGLSAIASKFYEHTRDLQEGGCLVGQNDTPELRAKLSGVNRTNTVVESVFALEKFLSTREKGSNLVYRRGWTLFKYNKTWMWGEKLSADGKLKLYGEVCRAEARRLRNAEGSQRAQLARLFKAKAAEREEKLTKLRERANAREAERKRLLDPSLRCTTFSSLKLLLNPQLIEQLKIRRVVDKRTESSGKPLICTPPPKGGRAWLVMKLQGLMELEYKEKVLKKNPNDLAKGDLGCDSRAPRKAKARATPAEAAAAKKGRSSGRKRQPVWDEEQEDWPVEAILDRRAATSADVTRYAGVEDSNVTLGSAMYLVAWEGWDPSYNSWEPYSFIVDDELIQEYEARADAAEDEAAEQQLDEAEEVAAEAEAAEAAEAEAAEAVAKEKQASPTGGSGEVREGDGEGDVMETEEEEPPPPPPPPRPPPPPPPPSPPPNDLPSFRSDICACVLTALQEQMSQLEADNMSAFPRNGGAFTDYFQRWDLTVHTALSSTSELIGFAISGAEGRGGSKVFLYELHVRSGAWRDHGVGSALIDLVERTARGRSPTVELNVHKDNVEALRFYEGRGFGACGDASATSLIMRRKR